MREKENIEKEDGWKLFCAAITGLIVTRNATNQYRCKWLSLGILTHSKTIMMNRIMVQLISAGRIALLTLYPMLYYNR